MERFVGSTAAFRMGSKSMAGALDQYILADFPKMDSLEGDGLYFISEGNCL
jgi:hypothetical protein